MSSRLQVSWLEAPISECLVVRIDFGTNAGLHLFRKQYMREMCIFTERKPMFAVLVHEAENVVVTISRPAIPPLIARFEYRGNIL
jgi:hypothetical protein